MEEDFSLRKSLDYLATLLRDILNTGGLLTREKSELSPDEVRAIINFVVNNKLDDLKEDLQKIFYAWPRHHSTKSSGRSAEMRVKGNQALKEGHLDQALAFYNDAVRNGVTDTEDVAFGLANRGLCLAKMNLCGPAITDINLALRSNYPEEMR